MAEDPCRGEHSLRAVGQRRPAESQTRLAGALREARPGLLHHAGALVHATPGDLRVGGQNLGAYSEEGKDRSAKLHPLTPAPQNMQCCVVAASRFQGSPRTSSASLPLPQPKSRTVRAEGSSAIESSASTAGPPYLRAKTRWTRRSAPPFVRCG